MQDNLVHALDVERQLLFLRPGCLNRRRDLGALRPYLRFQRPASKIIHDLEWLRQQVAAVA